MEELLRYRWPGNVRELKNVIERAVVLTRSEYIDHDDLVLSTLRTAGDTDSGLIEMGNGRSEPASLADIEKQHIVEALQSNRLEQEPSRHYPGHRALDAGPQNPPVRSCGRKGARRLTACG